MDIPIGPVFYQIQLVESGIFWEGRERRGLCDGGARRILIDARLPVDQRLSVFWHELAHAIVFEFDVRRGETFGHETLARILSLGLSSITPHRLARVRLYLRHGREYEHVYVRPDGEAIPVLRFTADAAGSPAG